MANFNLSARKSNSFINSERKNKLYNYLAAAAPEREQAAVKPEAEEAKENNANLLTRILATGGDLLGNVVTGAAKGVEGIADLVIGLGGAVGGIFDEGIRDDAQKAIEYDATHQWLGRHIDRLTEDSFTNNSEIGQIVESVASGVGQLLPTVAITFATGGLAGAAGASASAASAAGQTAGLVSMGVSAAGSGTEEAYKDGAGFYEGLGYGAVSGATEVATEKLFGGLTKGLTGKGLLDFGEEVADQGIKRVLKGAVEEGTEEVISHAVNPLTKTIYKGKDALKEYADPEYYKEGGKAFLTGAGTGMVYGSTVGKAINRAQGVNDDIGAAVEANENIREKLIRAQDSGKLTVEAERDAADAELKNLQSIEKSLKKADEETRKTYIKNYHLESSFNEDGSIRPEILAQERSKIDGKQTVVDAAEGEKTRAEQLDRRYYSVDLRGKEQTVRDDLKAMSSEGVEIRPFAGELSENAQKNFTKMKKALTSLNKHRGESVSFVIVEENDKFNGAERRGDTIYIAADTLERDASTSYLDKASVSGNFAGTMLHEYDHTNEGTKAHSDLVSFLAQDELLYATAEDRVLSEEYDISSEEIDNIVKKQKAGEELSPEEQQKLTTFRSEIGATMSEHLLGNERVIRKLVREGDPLVERVVSWFESVKKSLAGEGERYTLAEKRRIDKALKLYKKAAEAAGKMDLVKRIMALREEDEAIEPLTNENGSYDNENGSYDNENGVSDNVRTTNGNNMNVSEGEVRYSRKIEPNMTDAERYEVLKKRSINNIPLVTGLSDSVLEKIPEITSWEDINKFFGKNKKTLIKKLAEEFKVFGKQYFNDDTQLSFKFSGHNFAESYNKQERNYVEFAKMFSVFESVIESAVGVEIHNRSNYKPDPTLDNVFVLMSAYQDGDYIVPVKLEVKKFKDKQNTLYVAISLEKIKMAELNARGDTENGVTQRTRSTIQTEVLGRGNTENGVTQQPRSVNISIAKIFEKINPSDKSFIKYIPDGFLNEAQKEAKRQALDAERKAGDTRFSYKAPAESKVYKRIAEWEKLKVYEKADAEKMLYTILSDVMSISEDQAAVMTMESRKEAEKLLWAELNKALTEKEMKAAADKVAEFLISRSVIKSWLVDPYEAHTIETAETVLSHLKPYLHNLNLTHIKGEIKHKYDTAAGGVMLMWGTKKSGYGVDQIVSELNSQLSGYGFPIDVNANEADLFFAIHEAYTKARKDLEQAYESYKDRVLTTEERAKLKSEISEKILETYKESGRESTLAKATRLFKAELWKADQRVEYMKQYNVLISKVDAFRDLTMGKFLNANTYHPDLFTGSIEQLKKIVRGGLISVKLTKKAIGELAQWYRPDNPIVGEANYDSSIAEKLAQVADRGLSNYAGKKIDVRGILEPFMHRIDLSGIKKELKEIYGEENRSILATWNLKPDMEPVTLREIADALEKEGVQIYGGELELFTQIDSIYRDAVGPLTAEDLKNLSDIVAYFTKFIKNFNKVWNGKKYIEAEPLAKKYVTTIRNNSRIKIGWFNNLIFGRYGKTFFRPETLARRMDLYEDGFYTQTLHEFRQGLIQANDYEYEMMKAVADFDAKHKHYFSDLAKRRIDYRGNMIPADIALSLYMTSKRQQAQAGLAVSGFKYNDGKDTMDMQGYMPQKTPGGVEIGAERMQKLLWDEFSKEDKEFIGIAEALFNGRCKQLKHDTDMNTKGYSNTVDGYYYPIKRAFVAKSVDSDFEDLMGRASNKSFNKDTVIGAKGVLCIMPLTEVLSRHVRGVAQYASLATVVRNYDTLYNFDVDGDANNPGSVARESEKIWKEGGDYFKKLLADMQGIGEKQSAFLSVIRGSYATYQLGGNPKTWVTQFSSFFASTSVLKYENVVKGVGIDGSDVDEYCVLAKLRNANNDAIMAQANANKPGLLNKRTKVGEVSKKISDTLMAPIGVVDRFVVTKLFGACQAEVESRGGAKIGTKENKIEAGKLLEEVIIKTQQNSLATERSAAMRGGDIFKSLTMFSADGMNVFGQVVDAVGEVTAIKARLKGNIDASEKAMLEGRLKKANKAAASAISSLVTSAAFMAAISLLFNWLYHRIDDEDDAGDIAADVTTNFVGNMMGGLPVFRDMYSYLTDGYEVQNYMYSVLNDTLDAAASARDLAVSAFNDDFDSRKAAQTARKVIYAGGQLLGIPTRNLYNVTYSILGFIPSVKYGIDDMFYEQAYTSDLKKAIEAGDDRAIATIAGIMTGERVGDIEDDKVREELNKLTLKGHSVLPRAIADSVTVGEESVKLSGKQKKQFKEIYSIANESVTELMALKQYSAAEEEIRAKAVKLIYDIYYQLALDDIVGGSSSNKNVLFAEAISVEKLAIIVATARSIEADKDKKGISISGSKKKKIEKYIQSLNLTAAQKYMIMGYLGYKNSNGESQVKSYIGKLNLTKDEKAELLKYSGY